MNDQQASRISWTRFPKFGKFFAKEYGRQSNSKWGAVLKDCSSLCVTIVRFLSVAVVSLIDSIQSLIDLGLKGQAAFNQIKPLPMRESVNVNQFTNRMTL
jgi:hypothetical protein